jgi:plastocyanin
MRLLPVALAFAVFTLPAFAADHAVSIKGMAFDPPTLEVAAGDTITFTNEDSAPHTATALDGSFDTGRLGKGDSAQVTIAAAGAFDYKCNIHPSMKGAVTAK